MLSQLRGFYEELANSMPPRGVSLEVLILFSTLVTSLTYELYEAMRGEYVVQSNANISLIPVFGNIWITQSRLLYEPFAYVSNKKHGYFPFPEWRLHIWEEVLNSCNWCSFVFNLLYRVVDHSTLSLSLSLNLSPSLTLSLSLSPSSLQGRSLRMRLACFT